MTKNEKILNKAWMELLAAIGGKKNIVAIGTQNIGNQHYTSLHLVDNSKVQFSAFTYMNNVYCLEQSQGISIVWQDSNKAKSFTNFLRDVCYTKVYKGTKLIFHTKIPTEQIIRPYNFEEIEEEREAKKKAKERMKTRSN